MPSPLVVSAANVCLLTVPVMSLAAYLPQWAKLFRTRSSAAISVRSWVIWSASSSFALFYAIVQLLLNGAGWALVISTVVSLTFVVVTLCLVIKFRPRRAGALEDRSPSTSSEV